MEKTFLNSLNDATKKNLTGAGNMAANISVIMLLVFIAQLSFALYALSQILEYNNALTLAIFTLIVGVSCYICFLYFNYYRVFSDSLTLSLKDNDDQLFFKSCIYLKKIFTLQFIATLLGIGLVITSTMLSL